MKEPGTLRNPKQELEPSSAPVSKAHTGRAPQQRNPSPPTRPESSNRESPPVQETGRAPRQSFFKNDEVKREGTRELPRIKPLTQEEIEALRHQGKNASGQTPLQTILDEMIPREHQETLTSQLGKIESASHSRCKPMPVYPQLQQRIEEISLDLNNFHVVTRNIMQADNIRREAGVSLEQVCDAITAAHRATRIALSKGTITKKDEAGRPVSMPYFFKCLRQKVGLTS